ncbi:transposase [Streptomyces sp. NPDC002133]|uniref:transposase n=1 Tax=Streptomyces sp. NPDC002133 TaxID=3154409 RepID=UPI00331A134E
MVGEIKRFFPCAVGPTSRPGTRRRPVPADRGWRRPPRSWRAGRVLDHCPELADSAGHIRDFAKITTRLDREQLPAWIATADEAALPSLRSFARNLRNDLPAVIQGLSTPWNSGIVEGRVTDIKAIKRRTAGRAGFPLLRKRVLLVAASRRPQSVTAATAS